MSPHQKRHAWKSRCYEAVREKAPKVKPEPVPPEEPIIKTCGCGAAYTLGQWQSLLFCGVIQPDDGEFAEMRTCRCGSSITIRVVPVTCVCLVPTGTAIPVAT